MSEKDTLEVIHKEEKDDIEERVTKALEAYEARKEAERKKAEAEAIAIEERAAELAEEKAKELLKDEKFWEEHKAPVHMKEAEPGFGPEEQKAAFRHWARTGDLGAAKSLQMDEGEEAKNLLAQSGTGTYLVPDDFVAEIVAKRDNMSFPRAMGVRVVNTNLPVVDIPAESTSVANATRTAEAGAYSTDLPAFAQNQVTVQKWTLRHTVSEEFLEDDAAGFDSWFTRSLARSLANTEAYYVAVGNGTNQHSGIYESGDTDALTFDSDTNITPDEIFELFMLLKDGYQADAAWLMDRDTWRYLATLRDSNNWAFGNADMLTINTSGGAQAGTLYGHPVFLQDDIDTRSTGNAVIAVGSPEYYALVERKGLTVSRNPYLQQANGLVDFFTHFRQSGTVLVEEAWKIGVMA